MIKQRARQKEKEAFATVDKDNNMEIIHENVYLYPFLICTLMRNVCLLTFTNDE